MKTLLALILFCSLSVLAQIPPAPLQWMEMAATPKAASGGGGCNNTAVTITARTTRSDSYWVGFKFTVGATNITVCTLERMAQGVTSTYSHSIKIFSASGVVVSGTVNMTGIAIGSYAQVSVSPTVLTAGTTYVIGVDETVGDTWFDNTTCAYTTQIGLTSGSGSGPESDPESTYATTTPPATISDWHLAIPNCTYSAPNFMCQ